MPRRRSSMERRYQTRLQELLAGALVGAGLGQPDGVLVLDPSAFPKKGTESVGVQRQWCGRFGKFDNCQVGVYLAYVSREEHALGDTRLYLPQKWARSKRRRAKCGVGRGKKSSPRGGQPRGKGASQRPPAA